MSSKKLAHLLGFIQHGVNSHATGMWRHSRDKVGYHFSRPDYWQHMARTMERGLFDAMFIADELAPYTTHENSSDAIVKWAVQCPTHEPSTIVPIITTATTHLGVGITLSTAFEHPYSMCRRLSSLDHLSDGRIAWNIVSSYSKSEWEAYGHEMTERTGRYERLDEYMEVCYKLWDSWEPDAIIADKASGVYADPAKVHVVHHEGKFYRCHARHFCAPSLQGRPVLWQAGSSNQGRDFAAKHAEAIFAVHPNVDRMRQYADDLNDRLVNKFARVPGSVKLIYGLQTVVAETRAEAQEKYESIRSCIPPEGALAWMSGHFGLDFSKYSLDECVQNIEVPGIQGLFESIVYAKNGAPVTIREAAMIYAMGMGMPVAVGTPADIADQMEVYMDEGGADGFMLVATYTPGCFEEFVDLVVPELQRRGRHRTAYRTTTLREHLLQKTADELALA
jgi:FMN-dependent oxidoreductase (nitrilotriacetate monooxygenase family)